MESVHRGWGRESPENHSARRGGKNLISGLQVKNESSLQVEQLLKIVKKLQEAGELEPKIEDLIGKIKKLQEAKNLMDEELCNLQFHSEALQEELDRLNAEKSYLKATFQRKQETLGILQLQCEEKEAETERKQQLSQNCKQRIEELMSRMQEEKLKQRKQRHLFEEENRSARGFLEEASLHHSDIQQKCARRKVAATVFLLRGMAYCFRHFPGSVAAATVFLLWGCSSVLQASPGLAIVFCFFFSGEVVFHSADFFPAHSAERLLSSLLSAVYMRFCTAERGRRTIFSFCTRIVSPEAEAGIGFPFLLPAA
ncbi:uncharacterized protein LOC115096294 isoform X3 [Rhinatrema bivittatum]|uniref:uncharacterized protein LOC115096294 isoform X3 n=1 Tax=Rhinatrema bivittatum TaxID=194408 RepID=UPI001126E56C|nr:uncharacterized protein LOC115096294 isoform X3 [Rhinatrema bivittatum]